jgi:hypothetical protein
MVNKTTQSQTIAANNEEDIAMKQSDANVNRVKKASEENISEIQEEESISEKQ